MLKVVSCPSLRPEFILFFVGSWSERCRRLHLEKEEEEVGRWRKVSMRFDRCPVDVNGVLVMLLGDDFSVMAVRVAMEWDGDGLI